MKRTNRYTQEKGWFGTGTTHFEPGTEVRIQLGNSGHNDKVGKIIEPLTSSRDDGWWKVDLGDGKVSRFYEHNLIRTKVLA